MCQLLEDLFDVERNQMTLRGFLGSYINTQQEGRYRAFYAGPAIFLSVLAEQLGKFSLLKGLAK